MINKERLAETFKWLVSINSISRDEALISEELQKIFKQMGATIFIDGAGNALDGNTGNLIVKFKGTVPAKALLISGHLDTVEPGRNITVLFSEGVFRSDGKTILGADDKSAVAIILEVVRVLHEQNIPFSPLDIVFTICEEIGLLGSKNLNFNMIDANYGYSLDATDTRGIITKAPSANRFEFKVHGKDAHAGAVPEKGINAISLASKAIASLTLGRIDHETTCNIGKIEGGIAENIVPNLVVINGEVRSHNDEKLNKVTKEIVDAFVEVIDNYRKVSEIEGLPRVDIKVENDFRYTNIPDDHPVVLLAKKAGNNLGYNMITKTTGGGSDANIFFEKGIITAVLGTGMKDMHTVQEYISLDDMVSTAELLLEIIKIHSTESFN